MELENGNILGWNRHKEKTHIKERHIWSRKVRTYTEIGYTQK